MKKSRKSCERVKNCQDYITKKILKYRVKDSKVETVLKNLVKDFLNIRKYFISV